MKINLAVVFGSRTCEHDVSIISGIQALNAANPEAYNAFPVYIGRDGAWYVGERLREIGFYPKFDAAQVRRVLPMAENGKLLLIAYPTEKRSLFGGGRQVLETADVVLPVMHGVNGEDGTLQGMLELMDVPYACTGVMGAAVGMDKIAMKRFFRGCGFPVLPDCALTRTQWERDPEGAVRQVEEQLPYPVFVKPACLGSSIGVSRADGPDKLREALTLAFSYDRRVLVEQGLDRPIEVNCSVLGFDGERRASVLEMPNTGADFLDFSEKYLAGSSGSKGMASLKRIVPAPIGEELTKALQGLSLRIFDAMDCKGVVRIDYMLDRHSDGYYITEINTIPGSLAFYLWAESGLPYGRLIDEMVECALRAHREKERNSFAFSSDILSGVALGGKAGGKTGGKLKL